MNSMVDFDEELTRGRETYDDHVGEWWITRANDADHQEAYANIVYQISTQCKNPKVIVDYACGPGYILEHLAKTFPDAKLIGVDGSKKQLDVARGRLEKIRSSDSFELIESNLPNFELDVKADLVVFVFPNICPGEDVDIYNDNGYQDEGEIGVANELANDGDEDDDEDAEELQDDLLTSKVISRNLHSLCNDGGMCVRVEYSQSPRCDLDKLTEKRTCFEEGSLAKYNGETCEKLFDFFQNFYFESPVILDVYHQTKDEDDKNGGYFITFLNKV